MIAAKRLHFLEMGLSHRLQLYLLRKLWNTGIVRKVQIEQNKNISIP